MGRRYEEVPEDQLETVFENEHRKDERSKRLKGREKDKRRLEEEDDEDYDSRHGWR